MLKFLYLLPLFISCAKIPDAPVHTSFGADLQNCSGANLALVGTGTGTDTTVDTIVPVPVEQLTLSNIVVKEDIPFPTHPLVFLTLSAVLNDPMGGYVHFTISNDVGKKITQIETVPSNVVRWVPNLPQGNYKITAMPCNSLGCRKDYVRNFVYMQKPNNYPTLNNLMTILNECFGYIHELQVSGNALINNADIVRKYFEGIGLNLAAGDSCQSSVTNFGSTSMQNLSTLGAPVVGEILANPDAVQAEQFQLAANTSSTATSTTTVTGTSTSTTTTHSHSSNDAKVILLSLGIVGIVGGLMAFTTGAVQSKGWTSLIDNLETRTLQIVEDLTNNKTTYSEKYVTNFLNSLDTQLRDKIKYNIKKEKLTFSGSEDIPPNKKTIATQYSTLGKTSIALGISGVILAVAGIIGVAAGSLSLDLVASATTTSTNTNIQKTSPFDQAANYINTTILPLQFKLRQCSTKLYQTLQTATP